MNKIAPKRLPSTSHISIELPSDFDHSQDNLEGIALLPTGTENSSGSNSQTKLKLHFLITISWIIKIHILMGERAVWYFDKLMHRFRHTKQMRIFFPLTTVIQNLLRIMGHYDWASREAQLIYIKFSLTVCVLYTMSAIYHWITGKRFFVHLGAESSLQLEDNEGFKELLEKNTLMDTLLAQAKELVDRNENIPHDLALAINLAMTDALRLSNELFVASELLISRSGDGNGLPSDDIQRIRIEIYSNPRAMDIEDEPNMCSLCIKGFKQKEELRRLPCGHRFHVKCGDEWLKQLAACPNCKVRVERNQNEEQDAQV